MIDDYIPWLYTIIKPFMKTFNSKLRAKLKIESQDTETWKTKTWKGEKLVLPKNR